MSVKHAGVSHVSFDTDEGNKRWLKVSSLIPTDCYVAPLRIKHARLEFVRKLQPKAISVTLAQDTVVGLQFSDACHYIAQRGSDSEYEKLVSWLSLLRCGE